MGGPPFCLEAREISKAFPGVQALARVSLGLFPGEVLAVVGENGAGKSTLMKILAGVLQPDGGEIRVHGEPTSFQDVDDAQKRGIVLIHQELNLAENLDVAGNVFLGREPTWGPLRFIQRGIYPAAEEVMRRLGLDCSPRTLVSRLPVGQQQLVEIARALALRSHILIMDEPTSSLTQRETDRLFAVIRDLRCQGVSVLYISHRLKEVEEIADRVVVLRDGLRAGELIRDQINHEAIVRLMVGRELKQFFQQAHVPPSAAGPRLQAESLRIDLRHAKEITFSINPGEIVGLAGLMGSGRTELAEALFGIRPILSGTIRVDGRPAAIQDPRQAIAEGILLVPEDRRAQGLVLEASVKHNISLGSLDRLNRLGLVARQRERRLCQEMVRQLNIRTPHLDQLVGLLSGGNQQKVVLAKWLCRAPRLLILDEPTRGIDVAAKSEIYRLMDRLAAEGVGILMISSDLEEILGVSDRVLVMHEGGLAGELGRREMTEEAIMRLATGRRAVA